MISYIADWRLSFTPWFCAGLMLSAQRDVTMILGAGETARRTCGDIVGHPALLSQVSLRDASLPQCT